MVTSIRLKRDDSAERSVEQLLELDPKLSEEIAGGEQFFPLPTDGEIRFFIPDPIVEGATPPFPDFPDIKLPGAD